MSYLYGYETNLPLPDKAQFQEHPSFTVQPPPPKPVYVAPVVKQINKQEILNLINSTDTLVAQIYKHLEESTQVMHQEDADDIYGVQDCSATMSKASSEWEKLKRCLNKELELSSPISKPVG